jgi:diaminopimelate decarboxylase
MYLRKLGNIGITPRGISSRAHVRPRLLDNQKRTLMHYDHLANRMQPDRHFMYQRDEIIPEILGNAIKSMHLSPSNPIAMFIDKARFTQRVIELQQAFALTGLERVQHCLAVKALPLESLIKRAYELGMGAECASKGEIDLTLKAGIPPKKIIFDSPCKTLEELINALSKGIYINVDNFQELERVRNVIEVIFHSSGMNIPHNTNIGIRVNPVVGEGSISATSTATAHSKFGVNINEYYDELLFAYEKFPWLNSIHCHVGSQGCSIDMLVDGIKKTVEFAEQVNAQPDFEFDDVHVIKKHPKKRDQRIVCIDIGGGLPVNYNGNDDSPTFMGFVEKLHNEVPILFSNKYDVRTEFGRALVQKCGWIASKVEYTKHTGGKNIATIHAGAQLLLRTAYQPEIWKHHITVHTSDGQPKFGPTIKYDIVGPLCFSGDKVAVNVDLPPIEPGDYLVIHDAGGYSYCMFSRYNSRPAPPIYGYDSTNGDKNLKILKHGETSLDIMSFWQSA